MQSVDVVVDPLYFDDLTYLVRSLNRFSLRRSSSNLPSKLSTNALKNWRATLPGSSAIVSCAHLVSIGVGKRQTR
jgi:hypothetical protein